jgi:hypothetical protein
MQRKGEETMATRNDRRDFLSALGAGASGVVLASVAGQTQAADDAGKSEVFEGTSKQGDVKEALDSAIKAALDSAPGADRQVRWTLKSVSGVKGGFHPANEVTVAIEAKIV